MKPRGPLMIEHRLIEKALRTVEQKLPTMDEDSFDPIFIDNVVDFIRTYADRTHHGKEEDILFDRLSGKDLSGKDRTCMRELIDEHVQARGKVRRIVELNEEFRAGNRGAVAEIVEILRWLTEFYPAHIEKEDAVFFPDTEKYFSDEELDRMLEDFWEFDRAMIHEKYKKVLEELTRNRESG